MKTHVLLSLCGVLSAGPGLTRAADPAASWDFQDSAYVAGAAPSGTGVGVANTAGGNQILVVGGSSTPADPFASGLENKSISLFRSSADATTPIFQLQVPGFSGSGATPLASGTVTFDLYLKTQTSGRGSIEIDFGTFATTSSQGRQNSFAALQINASTSNPSTTGGVSYFSGATTSGSILSSGAVATPNAKNTISVSWDATAKTYSVWLNGTSIVSTGFTVDTIAGLSAIRFTTINATTDINYYIDNIVVSPTAIPEPGSVAAVLGGAGVLTAWVVRRRRAKR